MSLSFAFGGNTGLSYEELQRRRAFAEAMQQQGAGGAPRTAIEGLNGAAKSILGALLAKKFGAQEDKQKQEYTSTFGNIISGATQPGYGSGTAAVPPYVAPDPNNPAAIGHDTMRALGKASSAPTPDEIAAYIADAAKTRGIDPSVAVAVARSEGLNANPDDAWQSNFVKNGQREPSYGPFQLYMGGGLGNSFLKQTGLDPRDGSTWKKQVDFSLDHAKSNGWGSWYGAKRSGIGDFQGISGAPQPQNPGVDPSILTAMSDPRATPEQRSALGMLLQQRMQQADPAYQLNLQKSQLELAQMQNPAAEPVKLQTFTGADGATYSFNPVTGETKPVTGGKAPDPVNLQTFTGPDGAVYSFNPKTGETTPVTNPKQPDPGYRLLTPDEATKMGLPAGSYQVGADNKISKIGDNGTSVTINNGGSDVGTIPQGFELFTDPATGARSMRAIKGGPEDKSGAAAAKASANQTLTDIVTGAAEKARSAAGNRQFGGIGQGVVADLNPYSDSAEVQRQVAVLKANATIETLTAMRAASPTGGALGSVTESENAMLAAKAGALDPSSPNFQRDLNDYELTLLKIVHGAEAGQKIFDATRNGGTYKPEVMPAAPSTGGAAQFKFNPQTGKIEAVQ